MNSLGYDAGTLGNHDIEAGHPVYDRLAKEFTFPWLAANAVKPDGSPYFPPYIDPHRGGSEDRRHRPDHPLDPQLAAASSSGRACGSRTW